MSRVLQFSSAPCQRSAPEHSRAVLARLVDDLQLLAGDRPVALNVVAELARRLAYPIRHAREQRSE